MTCDCTKIVSYPAGKDARGPGVTRRPLGTQDRDCLSAKAAGTYLSNNRQ